MIYNMKIAFDTVNHAILTKIFACSVRGNIINLIGILKM